MHAIFTRLRHFRESTRGSMSAELAIVLPLLMGWIGTSLVLFDGYYQRVVAQKAAYTLSDLLSREMDGPIGPDYIDGMGNVFAFLTEAEAGQSEIRVSMVYCIEHCAADDPERRLGIDWSYSTDSARPALIESDLNDDYLDVIPIAAQSDRQIVVESFLDFEPMLDVGLKDDIVVEVMVVTRPRFTGQLLWNWGA